MISSMTGYAITNNDLFLQNKVLQNGEENNSEEKKQSEKQNEIQNEGENIQLSVELRALNSRFLDLHFRIPDEVRFCEQALREMITSKINRGKVEIRINIQKNMAENQPCHMNEKALIGLSQLQDKIQQIFSHTPALSLSVNEILKWPGVMSSASLEVNVLRDAIMHCSEKALEELMASRHREGEALSQVLQGHILKMEGIVARITPLVPKAMAQQKERMAQKMHDILTDTGSQQLEEAAGRILQEVTLYGIKIDIDEELSRLVAHLQEIKRVLQKGGRVGKRLDFIIQELNREANTLGSKSGIKEMNDEAIELKILIEQMREQVQNLE